MSSHDLVLVGAIGLLLYLPINDTWKLVLSLLAFVLGWLGIGL